MKGIAMRAAKYEQSHKEWSTRYSGDPRNEQHSLKDSEVDAQVNAVEQVTVYSVVEVVVVVVVKQVRNEQHSSKDRQVDVQVEQAIV
jgi:hypothetical protein